MRAVVQRVSRASVSVEGSVVGQIELGLAALVGVSDVDSEADAIAVADKLVGLRIFPDDEGKMNRSVVEAGGGVLVISQFTLLADVRKGRRPSFVHAAIPVVADPLVQRLAGAISSHGVPVANGEFGAHMEVDLINDGPVTIILETVDGRIQ
ncbi:MAG: D-tyrosyl-tRNA(Tyr) deacylase [Acidimicrobiia bacterium]|nr:D-tyrosyl-tRNA(Tyr) deacylase [Acidimicrobiia bacterium]MBT8192874.1 D-tyrosyl-tRNA(Tyr) deacylase [Acidimicrobiia bacterium]MBT8248008.1 D-tyrosyl-tRNA(Tyr) deacylase [Acidimicrobiia bacterium]NNF87217.1 D-tyrosyl-tRNA(Tyr) deacylase [Acidimicrobiia bacterium]NNJ46970.1 D-tyrosyl-tRNA(Tyr) deacylase [Acidimicrobiia bacterium]